MLRAFPNKILIFFYLHQKTFCNKEHSSVRKTLTVKCKTAPKFRIEGWHLNLRLTLFNKALDPGLDSRRFPEFFS